MESYGWNWVDLTGGAREPDELHMQRDEALLSEVEQGIAQPTVRCYTWERASLTIGRLQDERAARAEFENLSVYRRPTGGKAVRHESDLTIAVAARHDALAEARCAGGVLSEYRLLVAPVCLALARFGISAQCGNNDLSRTGKNTSADCFALAARCDVIDAERGIKIMGSAMRRTATAVLVQMSLRPQPTCDILGHGFLDELRAQYARYLNIGHWKVAA